MLSKTLSKNIIIISHQKLAAAHGGSDEFVYDIAGTKSF